MAATKAAIFIVLAGTTLMGGASHAAVIGTDNTTAGAYADGWQSGDNGAVSGAPFTGWNLVANQPTGTFAGFFTQDSTTISNSNGTTGNGGNINTGGKAFGMYGGGAGSEADAYRSFNGGPLAIGQAFSVDLVVNFRNGFKGINVRNFGDDATLFNFKVAPLTTNGITSDDYFVNSATTGNGSLGSGYSSNSVFHVTLTQTSAAGGVWRVDRSGGIIDSDTGTYTGLPSSIKLYVGGTDGGDPNNLYANNLAITAVPEPATFAVVGGASLAMFSRRRRR